MNALECKDEQTNMFNDGFFRRVSAQLMVACADCQQYLADIDGTCPLCRALRRLSLEARSLPVALRTWATDQARVWVSLLQEERLKFLICSQQAAERQAVAASTPKASSPVVFGEPTPTTTQETLPAATKEEPAAEGEGRLASPEEPEETKESQESQAPSSPIEVAVPEEKAEEKTEKKHKDSKKHKERSTKRKPSEESFSRKREVTKKEKAKKKNKKSRTRKRKASPSRSITREKGGALEVQSESHCEELCRPRTSGQDSSPS